MIDCRLVQPEKAPLPVSQDYDYDSDEDNNDDNNKDEPILITLLGITIDLSDWHALKTLLSITEILDGISNDIRLLHPEKAPDSEIMVSVIDVDVVIYYFY